MCGIHRPLDGFVMVSKDVGCRNVVHIGQIKFKKGEHASILLTSEEAPRPTCESTIKQTFLFELNSNNNYAKSQIMFV